MEAAFRHRDMTGSVFNDVNLRNAVFEDVNLAGATIHDSNLADVSIDAAYIRGMTVQGVRIDLLVEAELDRREPERVRLRMADPFDPECVRAALRRVDELREAFRARLRAAPRDALVRRPEPERWSAVVHLRHLIFVEDHYTNHLVLGSTAPRPSVGMLPTHLAGNPDYAEVGTEPTDDLEALLAVWESLHEETRAFVARVTAAELHRDVSPADPRQGTVSRALQVLVMHDLEHIRQAEAAIASAEAQTE